jgi:hypothetical protein
VFLSFSSDPAEEKVSASRKMTIIRIKLEKW